MLISGRIVLASIELGNFGLNSSLDLQSNGCDVQGRFSDRSPNNVVLNHHNTNVGKNMYRATMLFGLIEESGGFSTAIKMCPDGCTATAFKSPGISTVMIRLDTKDKRLEGLALDLSRGKI